MGQQRQEEIKRLFKVLDQVCGRASDIFLTGLYCNLKATVKTIGSLVKVWLCHEAGLGIKVQTMKKLLGWLTCPDLLDPYPILLTSSGYCHLSHTPCMGRGTERDKGHR